MRPMFSVIMLSYLYGTEETKIVYGLQKLFNFWILLVYSNT